MVAKALFLTMRSRPDIRLAVAFLCTRVKNPTTYDWFKLQRMMNFLHRTQSECLTLGLDGSRKVTWSIDAAFAVHPDMKSHSVGILTTRPKVHPALGEADFDIPTHPAMQPSEFVLCEVGCMFLRPIKVLLACSLG